MGRSGKVWEILGLLIRLLDWEGLGRFGKAWELGPGAFTRSAVGGKVWEVWEGLGRFGKVWEVLGRFRKV